MNTTKIILISLAVVSVVVAGVFISKSLISKGNQSSPNNSSNNEGSKSSSTDSANNSGSNSDNKTSNSDGKTGSTGNTDGKASDTGSKDKGCTVTILDSIAVVTSPCNDALVTSGFTFSGYVKDSVSKSDSWGIEVKDSKGKKLFDETLIGYVKGANIDFSSKIKYSSKPSSKSGTATFYSEDPFTMKRTDLVKIVLKF